MKFTEEKRVWQKWQFITPQTHLCLSTGLKIRHPQKFSGKLKKDCRYSSKLTINSFLFYI